MPRQKILSVTPAALAITIFISTTANNVPNLNVKSATQFHLYTFAIVPKQNIFALIVVMPCIYGNNVTIALSINATMITALCILPIPRNLTSANACCSPLNLPNSNYDTSFVNIILPMNNSHMLHQNHIIILPTSEIL